MMQIVAVKLENAKSYESAVIEFAPGVNAIVGHNGAGKSTILEAIGLALFDRIAYKQSEFVRAGARTATVTVTFESNLDGRLYDVVRRLGGSNQHYVHDPETGVRVVEGKVDVLSFLRQHLGVESTTDLESLFRDAVGVGQGTFTAAFLGTPAQRKGVFDPLLQVEDYRKAVDALREPGRLLRERQQALEVSIAGLRARLEALPGLQQAVEAREREIRRANEETEQRRAQLDAVMAKRGALDAVRSELAELRGEHDRMVERERSTARELKAAQQAQADAEAARALVDKHQMGYEAYLAAQERQKELDARLRERQRLEAERARGDTAMAVTETRLAQLQQELSEIDNSAIVVETLAAAVKRQNELELEINRAQQDAARLKDLEVQVSRQRAQLAHISSRSEQLAAAMGRSSELETSAAGLAAADEMIQQEITGLRDENARLKSEADGLIEQSHALEGADSAVCPVCEQPLTEEHRVAMLQRNGARVEALRGSYRQVQEQVRALQSESEEKRKRIRELEQELRVLPRASELESLATDAAAVQSALDGLLAQQAQLAGSSDRIGALQRELGALGDPRREYDAARRQVERKGAVTGSIAETTSALAKVRATANALQAELARFDHLDAEMDASRLEIRENEESYRVVLSNRRLAVTAGERGRDAERLAVTLTDAGDEIGRLAERVEQTASRFDEQAYAQVSAQEQLLRSNLGALDARLEMMQSQQEADRRSIDELRERQSSLDEAEREVRVLVELSDVLETIRTHLRQAGPYVTRVLIRQVSDNARQIFGDIMQDFSRHLSWNEDYGITLEVDGHEREFTQLSGGEQMTAALAVRLALLRELSSIDVAFFDEPTANLDEARREALARQILEVKGFSQLFVISHDDTFEQATQNLIRVERMNGTSTVSAS